MQNCAELHENAAHTVHYNEKHPSLRSFYLSKGPGDVKII